MTTPWNRTVAMQVHALRPLFTVRRECRKTWLKFESFCWLYVAILLFAMKTKIRSLLASWSGCRETYVYYLIIALLKSYKLVENSVYWRYFFFYCGIASLGERSSTLILSDETIMFSGNVKDQTPVYSALHPRRREIWTAPLRKPKISSIILLHLYLV
jgi:hypothetical protein